MRKSRLSLGSIRRVTVDASSKSRSSTNPARNAARWSFFNFWKRNSNPTGPISSAPSNQPVDHSPRSANDASFRKSGPTSSPSCALAFPFSANTSTPPSSRYFEEESVGLGAGVGGRLTSSTISVELTRNREREMESAVKGGVDGAGVGNGAGTLRI